MSGPTASGSAGSSLRPGGERGRPLSRLRLPADDELPPALTKLLAETGEESIRAIGLNPVTSPRFFDYMISVMSPEAGALPAGEREVVAVTVAAENRCVVSLTYHLRALAERCQDAERAMCIAVAPETAGLTERETAIVAAARTLTATPGAFGDAAIARLREVGLTDDEIFGVIEVTAAYNCATRIESALGLRASAGASDMSLHLDAG